MFQALRQTWATYAEWKLMIIHFVLIFSAYCIDTNRYSCIHCGSIQLIFCKHRKCKDKAIFKVIALIVALKLSCFGCMLHYND